MQTALGARIRFFMGGDGWNEVVGVVGHVRHGGPAAADQPQVYVPFGQRPDRSAHVVLLHEGPSAPVVAALRTAVHTLDPAVAVYDLATMEERLHGVLIRERGVRDILGVRSPGPPAGRVVVIRRAESLRVIIRALRMKSFCHPSVVTQIRPL